MVYKTILALLCLPVLLFAGEGITMKTAVDRGGHPYEYVPNDPFDVRIYKLKNGLTLYLSRNTAVPRVAVMTMVRAGSTDEPEQSTGLAHYFEHMMFKGSPRMGSLDWAKEKKLLDRISDLFEQRKKESDPKKKELLYQEIDKLSGEAAKYAVAGEFSALASALGTAGLNAATSHDYTFYIADVPSNELEKYLKLDAERFSEPVLRLFHTELEAVYEEFNRSQDKDHQTAIKELCRALLPVHPGGRPIIGEPEHLKNPSMKDIMKFYDRFYVPGNMAVALVGDLDFEKAYEMVENTFGRFPAGDPPKRAVPLESPLKKNQHITVSGPEAEMAYLGFRMERSPENDALLMVVSRLLSDDKYGMLDQNLLLTQELLDAGAFPYTGREYEMLILAGMPRGGQSLNQVEKLLLQEIEKLRKGDYEDWRIKAVAENCKVELASLRESGNMKLCHELLEIFINKEPYSELLKVPERVSSFTKKDISEFIEKYFKYHVRIDKKTGKPDHRVKVPKPKITPVVLNTNKESAFGKAFRALPPAPLTPPPVVDLSEDISTKELPNGITVKRANKYTSAELFHAKRIIALQKYSDLKIALALGYLDLIGTNRYSAKELRQEFYKLGVKFHFGINNYDLSASISGPAANLKKALELLQHFICDAKPDEEAYRKYVDDILKDRANRKLDPMQIFARGVSFGWYGPKNPYTDILDEKTLRAIKPEELTALVRKLFTEYESTFAYAGPASVNELAELASGIETKGKIKPPPWSYKFTPKAVEKPKVYLISNPSVQLRIGFISRGPLFSLEQLPFGSVFNDYFCAGGLDSVVFQEIRESRALAYAAGGSYEQVMRKDGYNVIYMLAGTQGDKLFDVIDTMSAILKKMPLYENKFQSSRTGVLKSISTERITGLSLITFEKRLERLGIKTDWRQKEFQTIMNMKLDDLNAFFNTVISPLKYHILVVGKITEQDREKLAKYGEIVDLKIPEIFGY